MLRPGGEKEDRALQHDNPDIFPGKPFSNLIVNPPNAGFKPLLEDIRNIR
jgi:hypothetical protein